METQLVIDGSAKQAVETLIEESKKLPPMEGAYNEGLDDSKAALLGVLGYVLQVWPDQETAQSVNITLGLLSRLCDLKAGESLILSTSCPKKLQVRMSPIEGPPMSFDALLCVWCRNPTPPPMLRCCGTIGTPGA